MKEYEIKDLEKYEMSIKDEILKGNINCYDINYETRNHEKYKEELLNGGINLEFDNDYYYNNDDDDDDYSISYDLMEKRRIYAHKKNNYDYISYGPFYIYRFEFENVSNIYYSIDEKNIEKIPFEESKEKTFRIWEIRQKYLMIETKYKKSKKTLGQLIPLSKIKNINKLIIYNIHPNDDKSIINYIIQKDTEKVKEVIKSYIKDIGTDTEDYFDRDYEKPIKVGSLIGNEIFQIEFLDGESIFIESPNNEFITKCREIDGKIHEIGIQISLNSTKNKNKENTFFYKNYIRKEKKFIGDKNEIKFEYEKTKIPLYLEYELNNSYNLYEPYTTWDFINDDETKIIEEILKKGFYISRIKIKEEQNDLNKTPIKKQNKIRKIIISIIQMLAFIMLLFSVIIVPIMNVEPNKKIVIFIVGIIISIIILIKCYNN